jgi:hypothetical protein
MRSPLGSDAEPTRTLPKRKPAQHLASKPVRPDFRESDEEIEFHVPTSKTHSTKKIRQSGGLQADGDDEVAYGPRKQRSITRPDNARQVRSLSCIRPSI